MGFKVIVTVTKKGEDRVRVKSTGHNPAIMRDFLVKKREAVQGVLWGNRS